jgi:hypothetical protein
MIESKSTSSVGIIERIPAGQSRYIYRRPMMGLGVTEYIWFMEEMVTYQTIAGH